MRPPRLGIGAGGRRPGLPRDCDSDRGLLGPRARGWAVPGSGRRPAGARPGLFGPGPAAGGTRAAPLPCSRRCGLSLIVDDSWPTAADCHCFSLTDSRGKMAIPLTIPLTSISLTSLTSRRPTMARRPPTSTRDVPGAAGPPATL